ncbi:MAG: Spore germination protein B1 [Candidatus Dichloromethanomonas elyunquensis]|nr:MAG: Spore germination protein B1 [Candidatus Dichloromethanomonas elyunquensis]
MFGSGKLSKRIIFRRRDNTKRPADELNPGSDASENISTEIENSKDYLKCYFKNSSDLVFGEFEPGSQVKVLIVYIDGLGNTDVLNRDIMHSFIAKAQELDLQKMVETPEKIRSIISVADVTVRYNYAQVAHEILSGASAILIDGMAGALIVNSKLFEKRAVSEPPNEAVVRGPKESFVENLRTNTSLLRRKIRNNNLVITSFELGTQTKTNVAIAYIDGIAKEEVIEKITTRLRAITTDSILDAGYIEQLIEDQKFSLFPTIWNSEKPDVIAGKILEGRVAIFCDGTPHVLTVPTLFIEHFQVSEDYYVRPYLAFVMRLIRIICFFVAIFLPSFYVALQTFHQEMIPTVLLVKMSGAMSGIPLPTLAETILMIFFYEILRESGTRLPGVIGPAISIVGALVVGESAVNAGIVSTTIVIVIALTAICSFAIPSLNEPIIILRLIFVLLAAVLGLFGVICGIFVIMLHIVSLRSFGANYTSPISPFNISDMKDLLIRFPLGFMARRPASTSAANNTRRAGKD